MAAIARHLLTLRDRLRMIDVPIRFLIFQVLVLSLITLLVLS